MIGTRVARAGDAAFLTEMLVEAVCWDAGAPRLHPDDVLARPENRRYVEGWPRDDDLGIVAEDDDHPVGAAWLRLFTSEEPGYGFLADDVPEVSIAVRADHRGAGLGTRLLEQLERAARGSGIAALSLSVETANPARRLYERRGYRLVETHGDSVIMRLEL